MDPVERAYLTGRALADLGRHDAAIAAFSRLLASDPAYVPAWQQLALARYETGDYAGLAETADALIALAPTGAEGYLFRSIALGRGGRYAEQLDAARVAVRQAPQWPWAFRQLAVALQDTGQADAALDAARHACVLDPTDVPSWCSAGRLAHRLGDPVEAERLYRQAVGLEPGHYHAMLGLATAIGGQYRFAEAATVTRQALALARPHERAGTMKLLASWLRYSRQYDEAVDLLRNAIDAYPDDVGFRRDLAQALGAQGRSAEAIEVTRSAVADLPDEAGSWLALVEALPPGDPERLAASRRGLEWAPPDRWSFLSAYSDELRYRGDLDGAAAALVELAVASPGEYTIQREVAQKLRWLGRPEDALRHADRAAELAPGNDLAHAEQAAALGALGRYAQALDAARAATDADPDFAYNWKLLAEHAYLAGRSDVATVAAQRAEAFGESHYAAEATAYAAWAADDLPGARTGFARALEHEPSCCCAQVDEALVSGAATAPLFAGPTEADRTGRCTNQSCWRRSRG